MFLVVGNLTGVLDMSAGLPVPRSGSSSAARWGVALLQE